jgi:hypothetical protein
MSQDYQDKINDSSCHFCARRREIEAHHIVPQRFNGRDTRENLVGVCERCHKKLERLYDKRFYEQLGIDDSKGERTPHFGCMIPDCTDYAEVRLGGRASAWYCKHHATTMMEQNPHRTVSEDLVGSMETRAAWLRDNPEYSWKRSEVSHD